MEIMCRQYKKLFEAQSVRLNEGYSHGTPIGDSLLSTSIPQVDYFRCPMHSRYTPINLNATGDYQLDKTIQDQLLPFPSGFA